MKTVPAALQSHLDGRETTLCRCWKLTRADATVQGFTDHDENLSFDGVTYLAASGFTASEVQKQLGLAIDNMTVAGALSSAVINEVDLVNGKYDNAALTIYLVNWADVSQRLILHAGRIGEVTRGTTAFQAELLGLSQGLNVEKGRKFTYGCDAVVGDTRCGVNLAGPAFTGSGAVSSVSDSRRLVVTGLSGYTDQWFQYGRLTWTSGANDDQVADVKRHVVTSSQVRVELWHPMPQAVALGDTFSIVAGCDKQFATCKAKFSNAVNFRGFPYMIGNDALISAASINQRLDGGSRYGN